MGSSKGLINKGIITTHVKSYQHSSLIIYTQVLTTVMGILQYAPILSTAPSSTLTIVKSCNNSTTIRGMNKWTSGNEPTSHFTLDTRSHDLIRRYKSFNKIFDLSGSH